MQGMHSIEAARYRGAKVIQYKSTCYKRLHLINSFRRDEKRWRSSNARGGALGGGAGAGEFSVLSFKN